MRSTADPTGGPKDRTSGAPVLERDPLLDKMRVSLEGEKEMKVKIAARLHVQLHSLKILEGKPIHETVTEALEAYFRANPRIGFDGSDRGP